jgi:hypothetical protein
MVAEGEPFPALAAATEMPARANAAPAIQLPKHSAIPQAASPTVTTEAGVAPASATSAAAATNVAALSAFFWGRNDAGSLPRMATTAMTIAQVSAMLETTPGPS